METTMMELRSKRGSDDVKEELPTGLSALIEAATSQLGHLVDTEDSTLPTPLSTTGLSIEAHHSFPERLMRLSSNPKYIDIITFLPDGKFFAIREEAFCESGLLTKTFDDLLTFEHFVTRAKEWGFSKLGSDGIAIFRHPSFQLGADDLCSAIQFGETPKTVRLQALQEDLSTTASSSPATTSSTGNQTSSSQQSKRRLSPRTRRESLSSLATKPRVDDSTMSSTTPPKTPSLKDEDNNGGKVLMDEDSVRSVAMAITTDRLKLKKADDDENPNNKTLVETAVSSATQEIVTDAIESLLRDEGHSKETFLKHEKELSRSSIPGVVPVCKQLFCSTYKDALQIVAMDQPSRVVTADEGTPAAKPDEEEDDHVLKEASNSPSTTHPTLSMDDNIKGMPKSIPEVL